jgi:hypothetical protein
MTSAHDSSGTGRPARSAADLLAPSTQIVADRDVYLGQGQRDVGRRISDDQVELFVSSDVAHAVEQEFQRHAPEFVALHDLGTSASLRLVRSLAGAAGAKVQRLSVRRQGHGVALAVMPYVEVPLADGTPVRVYTTDIDADAGTRSAMARVLLAHSRLGVLLVGELPPHAVASQLQPLHEALVRGPWPNRDLLLVPLGSGTALAAQATSLAGGSHVAVHVTPHARQPRQAWGFIGGAWNRLHGRPGGERALPTDITLAVPRPAVPASEAATQPMPLQPEPAPSAPVAAPAPRREAQPPRPMPRPGGTPWQTYAERCAQIKGTLACAVFDVHAMKPLAAVGTQPSGERLAQQGTALLAAMADVTRLLGLGSTPAEGSVSTGSHHVLLRPVPGHPGVAVHLVVSATTGNLTLARMQLERIEAPR